MTTWLLPHPQVPMRTPPQARTLTCPSVPTGPTPRPRWPTTPWTDSAAPQPSAAGALDPFDRVDDLHRGRELLPAGRSALDGHLKRLLSVPMTTVVSKHPRRDTTSIELARFHNYRIATTATPVFMGTI